MENTPCIRIGHLKIIDHLILGTACLQLKENKATLDHSRLETVAMNTWEQVCDGLIDGDINGAFMTAPLAMDLFSTGLDIRVLMFTHRSGSVIVKKKAPAINTLMDFKGKTVLVPSGLSTQNMLLHRLLSSAGLELGAHDDPLADVTYEIASPFMMAEMLTNDGDDDIAGAVAPEPFATDAVHKGLATPLCTSQSLWQNHPCSVFVLEASFIKRHPESVQEIITLFAKTGHLLETIKDDGVYPGAQGFLTSGKKMTRQVFLESNIRFSPSLLNPDIEALNMIQNYMATVMGVLKNKIDINILVDNSFILNTLSEHDS